MYKQYDLSFNESNCSEGALQLKLRHNQCIQVVVPHYKLRSPNQKEHWTEQAKRVKKEKALVKLFVRPWISTLSFPLKITLTRVSPRKFDQEDNYRMACKHFKDAIAHLFFPESKMGMADELQCFKWEYMQIKGHTKEHRLIIRFDEI